jgi:hypothetical protein
MALTLIGPRLRKAITRRKSQPRQQFGQAADATTGNGKGACTQTSLQSLIYIWTGVVYTLDRISAVSGYPGYATAGRGMTAREVQRALDAFHVPYKIATDLEFFLLMRAAVNGPVLVGVRYGDWPRKAGLPSWRNGHALENGATQLAGFDGAHMTLLLGAHVTVRDAAGRIVRREAYDHEPNHGSTARPEKPPYDRVTTAQLKRAYESLRTLGRSTYAFVPTRQLPV